MIELNEIFSSQSSFISQTFNYNTHSLFLFQSPTIINFSSYLMNKRLILSWYAVKHFFFVNIPLHNIDQIWKTFDSFTCGWCDCVHLILISLHTHNFFAINKFKDSPILKHGYMSLCELHSPMCFISNFQLCDVNSFIIESIWRYGLHWWKRCEWLPSNVFIKQLNKRY